ncbi:MAG: hypothetical protein JSR38_16840 [Proteobacteria bacterium]|nr:hypothetical protein [Pseudomonadota bacterium]
MSGLRVDHIAGRYYVHARVDVTHEPSYPGDVAEFGFVGWEVWACAEQDARGNWTYEWDESFDTEAEAVAAAHRFASSDLLNDPNWTGSRHHY